MVEKHVHFFLYRLRNTFTLDHELRMEVRSSLRDRSLKKGRPRRFFCKLIVLSWKKQVEKESVKIGVSSEVALC